METRLLKESYLEVVNYSVTHKNGNRSSVRTDILNSYIRQFFFDEIIDEQQWECTYEKKISCSRATPENPNKTFSIDLCFVNKKTKKNIYVLLKAMEKGIGKNAQNYGNTTVGECERLYGYSKEHGDKLTKERKDDVTIFITLAPSIELDSGRRWKDMSPHVENLTLFNPNIFKLDVLLSVDETKETEEERINSLGFIDNEKEVVEIVSNIKEII
tara:strand:- start:120 stop:764 length:645 start_codon:yes stop_codon:yes gene_type:complete